MKKALACLQRAAKPPPAAPDPRSRGEGLTDLHLTLDGRPDAGDAGILLAARRGYFSDAGVDLEITSPVIASNLPGYLDEGASDLGLLPQPQVTIARAEGMPLVAIGGVIRRPTMAMMSLQGSGIESVADLQGKTVAIDSLSFEEAALEAALARGDLTLEDVKLQRASYWLVPALVKGRADAIVGAPNIEAVELEACGVDPVVVPLRDLGIPPYEELDVVVRRDRLARDPRAFRGFMTALARGTAAAVAEPRAAAAAISSYRAELEAGHPQEPAVVEAKLRATLPLLSRSGSMDRKRAVHFAGWMREQGLIQDR
jgi:putative hydroxymethylpyrimidine transport system substrate-binding protein